MQDMQILELPFGADFLKVAVPRTNLAWVLSPRYMPPVPDIAEAVAAALHNPIGLPPLPELVKERDREMLLLVDDMTRSTPQHLILPPLLDELNKAGVPDAQITALIATGTHRTMSEAEITARFGAKVRERIRFVNHNCHDLSSLVVVENPYSSTPVVVNRLYYESKFSIAVGNIVPHMYAGWAGGAKMVQPGVCGPATTGETHFMAAENVRNILGVVDNPVRREVENIARLTGLTMIVNTILNTAHEVVAVVAGDPVQAHRRGVEIAGGIYEMVIDEPVDLVIASAAPADLDIWQSVKALNAAAMAVRPGGRLILCSASPAGVAPDHPDFVALGGKTREEAKKAFHSGIITDKVGLSTYLALRLNLDMVPTTLVSSGVGEAEARRMGFAWAPTLEQAVSEALAQLGAGAGPKVGAGPDGGAAVRIGVLTHAADIYIRQAGER
ncbi:MAG TPA: nickel-dependent lactate racemase [Firmicutes bacterium]|nr:nickel-dependent lactate racemase [Bacillota bacterium]